jgi:Uncharacterized protein involved in plasmid maintenance
VEIAINDEEVDLQMKLGRAGEAFFVEQVLFQENVPYNLATSPIPSAAFMEPQFNFKVDEPSETVKSFSVFLCKSSPWDLE